MLKPVFLSSICRISRDAHRCDDGKQFPAHRSSPGDSPSQPRHDAARRRDASRDGAAPRSSQAPSGDPPSFAADVHARVRHDLTCTPRTNVLVKFDYPNLSVKSGESAMTSGRKGCLSVKLPLYCVFCRLRSRNYMF